MNHATYLIGAIDAAVKAGKAIMDVYQSDFAVEVKQDTSPLTLADKRSHEIIQDSLKGFGINSISEEGKNIPYDTRKDWKTMWIVDPLDGTKEFVKRNGEFTVNIALVEDQVPIMGVVYAPVRQWLYFASKTIGAFKIKNVHPDTFMLDKEDDSHELLNTLMKNGTQMPLGRSDSIYTIVGSRSHATPELETFIDAKREEKGDVEFIAAGSSLKICLVAEGAADIYPRLGPTMEWDTAAGQAVAMFSGAKMYEFNESNTLQYNKENLLNPWFIVER